MKRTFFYFLVLFAVSLSANAEEEPKRLLVDGRVWKMMNVTKEYYPDKGWCSDTTFYSVQVKGEVEFEGKKCFKVSVSDDYLYMYEDNTGVYRYTMYNEWQKVFDFNLEIGDNDPFLGAPVTAIDKLVIGGVTYKKWVIGITDVVIEGIGSLADGLRLFDWIPVGGESETLFAIEENGQRWTFTEEDIARYEAMNVSVPTRRFSEVSSLYDISGRRINNMPPKGVYVRGGKKYVVK